MKSAVHFIKPDIEKRVHRIQGQMKGIMRMIEEENACPDILTQISAIRASLLSLSVVLLENHINHCVKEDIAENNFSQIQELNTLLSRLIK